jgi:uncharacterized membrane protein
MMSKTTVLAVALIASLCLNAFLIGAAVSKWRQFADKHPAIAAMVKERHGGPEAQGKAGLEAMLKRLPETVQGDVRKAMDEARPAMEEKRRAVKEARLGVLQALRAEPFDEAVLRAAMERQRTAMSELPTLLQETFIKTYASLSPEERREFLGSMRKFSRERP